MNPTTVGETTDSRTKSQDVFEAKGNPCQIGLKGTSLLDYTTFFFFNKCKKMIK